MFDFISFILNLFESVSLFTLIRTYTKPYTYWKWLTYKVKEVCTYLRKKRVFFFLFFFFAKWGENDGILAFQSQEFWYKSKILEYYCKIIWFCQCKLFSIICIFIYIFFSYTYYSTDLFFSSFSKLSLNIYLAHMLCKEKNKVLGKLAKIKQIFCYSRSTMTV